MLKIKLSKKAVGDKKETEKEYKVSKFTTLDLKDSLRVASEVDMSQVLYDDVDTLAEYVANLFGNQFTAEEFMEGTENGIAIAQKFLTMNIQQMNEKEYEEFMEERKKRIEEALKEAESEEEAEKN